MGIFHQIALSVIFSLAYSPGTLADTVRDDLSNCRGVNYNLTEKLNPIDQWLNYDGDMVDDNLDKLEDFGVNALRVFSSFSVWRDTSKRAGYILDIQDLATRAFEHDMLLMLILFDSYGCEPTGDLVADAAKSVWYQSPENSYLASFVGNPEVVSFIDDTLTAIGAAKSAVGGAQVILDAWNEPAQSLPYSTLEFVLTTIKSFGDERTTVGFAPVIRNELLLNSMADPLDLDVISYHPYGIFEAVIQTGAALARQYAEIGISDPSMARPTVASEVVNHGLAAQDCAHILDWMQAEGEGFILWEAFASASIFKKIDGLFYNDPALGVDVLVRDVEGVNKLLSLAIRDGFEPAKVARLLPSSSPSHIAYEPLPYSFTVIGAHDLLLNWQTQYAAETYSPTVANGFAVMNETPISFYRQILKWAIASNSKVNPYTGADLNTRITLSDQVDASIEAAYDAAEDYAMTMDPVPLATAFANLDAAFLTLANFLRDTRVESAPPGITPYVTFLKNTAPEIVYLRTKKIKNQASMPGMLRPQKLEIKMLFNDSDRLDDVVWADVSISEDGVNYTRLFLSPTDMEPNASGFISTLVELPFAQPGALLYIRGEVMDSALNYASVDLTIQ